MLSILIHRFEANGWQNRRKKRIWIWQMKQTAIWQDFTFFFACHSFLANDHFQGFSSLPLFLSIFLLIFCNLQILLEWHRKQPIIIAMWFKAVAANLEIIKSSSNKYLLVRIDPRFCQLNSFNFHSVHCVSLCPFPSYSKSNNRPVHTNNGMLYPLVRPYKCERFFLPTSRLSTLPCRSTKAINDFSDVFFPFVGNEWTFVTLCLWLSSFNFSNVLLKIKCDIKFS